MTVESQKRSFSYLARSYEFLQKTFMNSVRHKNVTKIVSDVLLVFNGIYYNKGIIS